MAKRLASRPVKLEVTVFDVVCSALKPLGYIKFSCKFHGILKYDNASPTSVDELDQVPDFKAVP
jgi:hypothetical protein